MSSVLSLLAVPFACLTCLYGCTDKHKELAKKPNALDSFTYVPSPRVKEQLKPKKTQPDEKRGAEPKKQTLSREVTSAPIIPESPEVTRAEDFRYKPSPQVLKLMSGAKE